VRLFMIMMKIIAFQYLSTIRHHTTLYKTIQQYIRLYDTVRHYTALYKTIWHYARLYNTILHYRRLLYKTIETKQHYTTLYKSIRHYTTLYVISMFSFVVELIVIYPVPVSRALISSLQSIFTFFFVNYNICQHWTCMHHSVMIFKRSI
jgi:hypothetical protein